MAIRKILVPLTGMKRDITALQAAAVVALRLQAHIEAFFVRPDPSETLPFLGEGVAGPVIQDILVAAKEAADAAAQRSWEAVSNLSQAAGIPIVDTVTGPGHATMAYGEDTGPFGEVISARALLSDLVVFLSPDQDEGMGISDALQECLMNAGRPIFLAPEQPIATVGEAATVGWDGSAEAAHAVRAAMPFLRQASRIDILNVTSGAKDTSLTDRLADYLAYHGLASIEHVVHPQGRPIGEVLINEARRMGSDVLVMGGYGHSRLREMFVGGATRQILRGAPIPVLLAH